MSASAAALRRPLDLPPAFTLVSLRESGDAFAHACRIAPEAGAGTFVHVGRFDLIEFAVVLEPEEPLRAARRAFFAGMTALADAIGFHCPPEKPVAFDWPDGIRFDGARVGGGRLGWPSDCPEDETPAWLVFAATLIAARVGGLEPGLTPTLTTLEEEGFDDGRSVIESFCRYLMLVFDTWPAEGFAPIEKAYLDRLPGKAGARQRLDGNGDLLIAYHGSARPERFPLEPALRIPSWLDPATGGPKLQ
jgi:hypothetical protein